MPRIDECNGNEPSIDELLYGDFSKPNRWYARRMPRAYNSSEI
jgi:hypothetical protein